MSENLPTRRRWFQFGLGTLLWLTLVAALAIYGVHEDQQRARTEEELREARVLIGKLERDTGMLQDAMGESTRTIERLLKRISPGATRASEVFSPKAKLPQLAPQP